MLVLPKIQQNLLPIKRELIQIIQSKGNLNELLNKNSKNRISSSKVLHSNMKNKTNQKVEQNQHLKRRKDKFIEQVSSIRFNWRKAEINLIQALNDQQTLKQLIGFQNICKQRFIPSSYSYFALKSILHIFSSSTKFQNNESDMKNESQNNQNRNKKMENQNISQKEKQLKNLIIKGIKEERKNIQNQISFYDKIQSFINLRQDILQSLQINHKSESYNLLHQNVNDIRFVNFQIISNIKLWKDHLLIPYQIHQHQNQKKQSDNPSKTQKNISSTVQTRNEPMFYFGQQNYLNKIVNDNANIINFVNKKNVHFISPPNPFFLTQDGNKQGMSTHQQQKIQACMEILAKQKGIQLKMLISPPQFYKSKYGVKLYESSKLYQQKQKNKIQKKIRTNIQNNPSLQLLKISLPKNKISPYITSNRLKSSSNIFSTDRNGKNNVKNSIEKQQQVLIKSRPSSKKLLEGISKQTLKPNTKQSYILKISALKSQVQKKQQQKNSFKSNNVQIKKNQLLQDLSKKNKEQINSSTKTQNQSPVKKQYNSIPRSMMEIKSVKPKIKLIAQRETNLQNPVNAILDPLSKLFIIKQSEKSKQQKQILKNSSSSFYKKYPKIQQVQEEVEKHQPITHNKYNYQKKKNTEKSANLSLSGLTEQKKEGNKNQNVKNSTSVNFLYKKPKFSLDLRAGLQKNWRIDSKKKSLQNIVNKQKKNEPFIKKGQIEKSQNEKSKQKIDDELLNLKNRLRDLTILKVYGKKQKTIQEQQKNQFFGTIVASSKVQSFIKTSPYKKKQKGKKFGNNKISKEKGEQVLKNQKKQKISLKKELNDKSKEFQLNQSKISQKQKQLKEKYVLEKQEAEYRLQKLQKRKQLIEESNKMKQKQISQTNKKKQYLESEFIEKQKKLKELEDKINLIKKRKKEKTNVSKNPLLSQKKEDKEEATILQNQQYKQKQTNIALHRKNQQRIFQQNKILQQKMEQEEKKFINLKQQEYKLREQSILKMHNSELQQVKQQFKIKQKQYEQKVLEEQRKRKQNQIKLIKEKREAQLMKMKIQQQQLKQQLLIQILNEQKLKEVQAQKQQIEFTEQIKRKIEYQLKQKQARELQIAQSYQNQKNKLAIIYEQMKKKNLQIQQQNKKKVLELQILQKQKNLQIQKLDQLKQKMVKDQNLIQNIKINQVLDQQMALISQNQVFSQGDLQEMKLKLKQQILEQIIKRKKIQQEQELAYEQQRKKHILQVQQQIKKALRLQDQQIQKQLEYQQKLIEQQKRSQLQKHEKQTKLESVSDKNQVFIVSQKHQNKIKQQQKQKQQKDQEKKSKQNFNQNINNKEQKQNGQKQIKLIGQQEFYQKQKDKKYVKNQKQKEQIIEINKMNIQVQNMQNKNQKVAIQNSISIDKQNQELVQNQHQIKQLSNTQKQEKKNIKLQSNQINQIKQSPQNALFLNSNIPHSKQSILQSPSKIVSQSPSKIVQQSPSKIVSQSPSKIASQSPSKIVSQSPSKIVQQSSKQSIFQSPKEQNVQSIKQQNIESTKQQKVQSIRQSIVQSSEQILQKYEALQIYLNRKVKLIQIFENQIDEYLNRFLNSYSVEVRQMFPFKKEQLSSALKNKENKIDIFDCNSLGWFDQASNKYNLIGSIQCIQLIAKKYGQIQIEQIYLFKKQNSYQKQYLIKQIKIFQNIGYIYQKKLKDQDIYSVKFIIKIPKEIIDQKSQKRDDFIQVYSSVCFKNVDKQNPTYSNNQSFSSLYVQAIKSNFDQNQLKNLPSNSTDISTNFILKIINERGTQLGLSQNNIMKSNVVDDNIIQLQLNFRLNYLTTKQQNLFQIQSKQVRLNNKNQTMVYLGKIPKMQNFTVLVQEIDIQLIKNSLLDLHLQTISEQINNQKNEKEIQRSLTLYLPTFSINRSMNYISGIGQIKPFVFRSNFIPKLIGSSIKFSNFAKQQFKFITPRQKTGFIFSIYQSNSNNLLIRPIWGTIVTVSDLNQKNSKN